LVETWKNNPHITRIDEAASADLYREKGKGKVAFRRIAPLNIPATCNFFCESCQWNSCNDSEVFPKIIIEKHRDGHQEYF